jgi:hypothetical protein
MTDTTTAPAAATEAMNPLAVARLCEPFPRSAISKLPKGGTTLDFVGHAAVTRRLLEVDPTWNWEPVAFDEDGLPKFDANGGLWLRLTICGVTRLGYGEPQGGDAFDKTKGAIGNAVRNAAMRFGVALDLWSKDDISTTLAVPATPATAGQVDEARALGEELGRTGDELLTAVRTAVRRPALESLEALTEPEAAALLALMRRQAAQARQVPEGVDAQTGEVIDLVAPVTAKQQARIEQMRAELGFDHPTFLEGVRSALKDPSITDVSTIGATAADTLIGRLGKAVEARKAKAA